MLARLTQLSRGIFLRARTLLPKKRLGVVGSFLVFAVVILGVFGVVDVIFAQAEMITWVMNGVISALSWAMFIIARLCIGLTIFFLKFFIEVAKYNNYIDTPTVKVGWFLVRDIANMFFVVLLLVISFGTILGVEQYEWKKTLGKLVFAAIFINFSNTIAQLIIDIAQVFTITFVNAISATAGGNIITMFNIDSVYKITGAEELGIGGNIRLETFGASVAVFFLALLMAVTIGAYALVMVARMVVLWTLIIISPLAYIFQVIPQTQKYAQEWWSQFINHVIVAPVMVFFLWLAFATLSAPQEYLKMNASTFEEANSALTGETYKLSISQATSWENLANYIIAIAFLLLGLRKVRELGVEAGGLTSSATGFAKKVAGYATGYVVGRAAYDLGKKGVKGLSIGTAKVLTEPIRTKLATRVQGYKARVLSTGRRATSDMNALERGVGFFVRGYVSRQKAYKKVKDITEQEEKLNYARKDSPSDTKGRVLGYNFQEHDADGDAILGEDEGGQLITKGHVGYNMHGMLVKQDEVGEAKQQADKVETKIPQLNQELADLDGAIASLTQQIAIADDEQKKELEIELRQKNADKEEKKGEISHATKEAEFMRKASTIDESKTSKFQTKLQKEIGSDGGYKGLARDRWLEGQMKGEVARKSAKDEEWHALGMKDILRGERLKDGKRGKGDPEKKGRTVAEEIAQRKMRAAYYQASTGRIEEEAMAAYTNRGEEGYKFLEAQSGEKAKTTRLKQEAEKEEDLVYARAQSRDYMQVGDILRAEASKRAVQQKWFEKDQDLFKNMNYTERMDQTKRITKELRAIHFDLTRGNPTTEKKVELQARQSQLVAQSLVLETFNNTADSDSSHDSLNKGLEAAEYTGDTSVKNRKRMFLSRHLGYDVGESADEQSAAEIEFANSFDGDTEAYQTYMRNLSTSQKVAALKFGQVSGLGVLDERVQGGTGRIEIVLNKLVDDKPQRGYFNPRIKGNSLETIGAFFTKDAAGKVIGVDDPTQREGLGAVVDGYDTRAIAGISKSFFDDWNNITLQGLGEDQIKSIVAGFNEQLNKLKDAQAVESFKHRAEAFVARVDSLPSGSPALIKPPDSPVHSDSSKFTSSSPRNEDSRQMVPTSPSVSASRVTDVDGRDSNSSSARTLSEPPSDSRPINLALSKDEVMNIFMESVGNLQRESSSVRTVDPRELAQKMWDEAKKEGLDPADLAQNTEQLLALLQRLKDEKDADDELPNP